MTADTLITILSVAGVILVTVYNIVSSKHYRAAKQAEVDSLTATIDSKQAEIDSLKQFTSSHVFDEHQAMKSMLESYIERLKEVIAELETEKDKQLAVIAEKDGQIAEADARQRRLNMLDGQRQKANATLQASTELYKNMVADTSFKDLLHRLYSHKMEPPST